MYPECRTRLKVVSAIPWSPWYQQTQGPKILLITDWSLKAELNLWIFLGQRLLPITSRYHIQTSGLMGSPTVPNSRRDDRS